MYSARLTDSAVDKRGQTEVYRQIHLIDTIMKALPLPPPGYETSDQVRAGISHAYSGVFNPRGLEKIWYGPYGQMLSELASTYNGHLTAQCQYPLWIPALQAMVLKLRKDFEENGLDYDDHEPVDIEDVAPASTDDGESDSSGEDGSDGTGEFVATGINSDEGREPSGRLVEHRATHISNTVRKRQKMVWDLLDRRASIFNMELEDYESIKPNLSIGSEVSRPDDESVDEEPDFVLSHVAHYALPYPPSPQAKDHYEHRAGVKVFHHCCPLIAEVKPAPPRFHTGAMHLIALRSRFWLAIENLIEYCSAYFVCNTRPHSVIAFAASGPFWKWAKIQRADAPVFDWRTKVLVNVEDPKVKEFHAKFGDRYFTLGTRESDRELSRLNQTHIFPMLRDGHYEVVTP